MSKQLGSIIKMLSIKVIFVVLLVHGTASVMGKANRFSLTLHEKGKSFKETVIVDTEKGTETLNVPQHGTREAVKVLNDFTRGWSMTRVLRKNMCYLQTLSSDVVAPYQLKDSLKKISHRQRNVSKTPVVKFKSILFTGRFTRYSLLSKDMKRMCQGLPIYAAESVTDPSSMERLAIKRGLEHYRSGSITKRQSSGVGCEEKPTQREFNKCGAYVDYLVASCTFTTRSCAYYFSCIYPQIYSPGSGVCSKIHLDWSAYCCVFTCTR